MRVSLILIGKTQKKYIKEGVEEYKSRLKRYIKFDIKEISDIKSSKKMPASVFKEKEGKLLLSKFETSDFVILLDERGKMKSSIEFARFIENKTITGVKHLVFVVGGAYGFSDEVYKRADYSISLSKMTFSHQPIRILFMEQIYRAFTIIKGEPYHNE